MQKFPFLGFCLMPGNWKKKTFVPVDHFPDFNLESATISIKNTFLMKNLTDFRKTVETGLDPLLRYARLHFRDRRWAASLRYKNRAATTVLVCEEMPYPV